MCCHHLTSLTCKQTPGSPALGENGHGLREQHQQKQARLTDNSTITTYCSTWHTENTPNTLLMLTVYMITEEQ